MSNRSSKVTLLAFVLLCTPAGCSSADGPPSETLAAGGDTTQAPADLSPTKEAPSTEVSLRTCDFYFTGDGSCKEVCCRIIPGEPENEWPCTVTYGPCPGSD